MLRHRDDSELWLLSPADLGQDTPSGVPAEVAGPAREVLAWARSYLSEPHAELGRPGPVCPYVSGAIRASSFYLTVRSGRFEDGEQIASLVGRYRDWFGRLEPVCEPEAQFKTILVIFPDIALADAPRLIDDTQRTLKPAFVASGLMIGQFHPTPPDECGLWNADFRPLYSPLPLLAIRQMVPSDLPFLTGDAGLVRAYLARFGDAVPARCRARLQAALAEHGLERPDEIDQHDDGGAD
jgi:hypothetical protein